MFCASARVGMCPFTPASLQRKPRRQRSATAPCRHRGRAEVSTSATATTIEVLTALDAARNTLPTHARVDQILLGPKGAAPEVATCSSPHRHASASGRQPHLGPAPAPFVWNTAAAHLPVWRFVSGRVWPLGPSTRRGRAASPMGEGSASGLASLTRVSSACEASNVCSPRVKELLSTKLGAVACGVGHYASAGLHLGTTDVR